MANATIGPKLTRRKTAAGMLEFFYERFDMKHAGDSELQFLARYSDTAVHMASSLAQITEGIGCLIDRDRKEGSLGSGSLQGDEQSGLLFHLAEQMSVIGEMAFIAGESNSVLHQRLLDRLRVERARRGHGDDNLSREAV